MLWKYSQTFHKKINWKVLVQEISTEHDPRKYSLKQNLTFKYKWIPENVAPKIFGSALIRMTSEKCNLDKEAR